MFHYKSPQCTPTSVGPTSFFVLGASNLVVDASNDLRLMELAVNPYQNPVFSGNPVSFLGWSIIDEPVNSVQGIHHPMRNVQKYLTGGPATAATEPGTTYGVWKFRLSNGFPETLSSGSPLFNPSKRVIGSCRAGAVVFNCSNFQNYDVYYVRLSKSWALLCQYLSQSGSDELQLEIIQDKGDGIPTHATQAESFEIGLYDLSGNRVFSLVTTETRITLDVSLLKKWLVLSPYPPQRGADQKTDQGGAVEPPFS